MNEAEEMFDEIQNVGMADIGTNVAFTLDGGTYRGIVNNPEVSTQMMTGGYQGRTNLVILATRDQFPEPPAQRGIVVITEPQVFAQAQWNRRQVEVSGAAHYAITIYQQLPVQ